MSLALAKELGPGPGRVGAQSGLGPSPGWGPVRVGAHMGPYGSSWTGLGRLRKLSVNFPYDFWTNLARFGSKTHFLMKFLNDSASFLLEKLKNQVIFKTFNIY